MKDCKLIVSDLDGTLLGSDMTVSPQNEKAIEKLNELGILFVPSSGRTLYEIPECVRENPNIRYITYSNGTAVYDKDAGRKIISHEISREDANKTVDILKDYDVLWTVHIDGRMYYDPNRASDEIFKYYQLTDYYRDVVLTGAKTDNIEKLAREAESVESFFVFFHSDEVQNEVGKRLISEVGSITVTASIAHEFELCSGEAGKGAALSELSELLGIPGEKIIAIGDSENDTPMFPYARLALAVSNGREEARELADKVICSNDEHVADYVLKNYIESDEPKLRKKPHKAHILTAILAAAVAVSLILVAIFFGESSSALKVGYIGSSTASSWSGTYKKLDGKMSHNIRTKNDTLKFSIKTESGSISVEVLDSENNTIFEKENVGTAAFEVEVDGRVKIIIEAEDHKGSFVIG